MTSSSTVSKISLDNLHLVFDELDPAKRLAELSRLWVPSPDCMFIDPEGVYRSHEAVSDVTGALQKRYPGAVFTELGNQASPLLNGLELIIGARIGPVEVINEAPDEDIRIARLPWRYGKPGETLAITGLDVLTIVGGKIKSLYTFIDK